MKNDKTGIVTEIIDKETVKVKVINSSEIATIKGNKFYIAELIDAYKNEETVIIKFNADSNTLIEELEEGDL